MGNLDVAEVGIFVVARDGSNKFDTIACAAHTTYAHDTWFRGSDLPMGTQTRNYIRTIKKSQFSG